MRAWAQQEGVDLGRVSQLRFSVPVLRWTQPHEFAARDALEQSNVQDAAHRDAKLRHAIWAMAAAAHRLRNKPGERAQIRKCIQLLRRAWWAHCTGNRAVARLMFALARDAWLSVSQSGIIVAGVRSIVAHSAAAKAPRKLPAPDRDRIRARYSRLCGRRRENA